MKWTANWSEPLKNGPRIVWPSNVLSAPQSLDFWMTGTCPAVSWPPPSTETMSGEYNVSITSKFLPWLHRSTNCLATDRRLMGVLPRLARRDAAAKFIRSDDQTIEGTCELSPSASLTPS